MKPLASVLIRFLSTLNVTIQTFEPDRMRIQEKAKQVYKAQILDASIFLLSSISLKYMKPYLKTKEVLASLRTKKTRLETQLDFRLE